MKNLIYQYWDGDIPPAVDYSIKLNKEYASRIGADYKFDHNRKLINNLGHMSHFFGTLTPVFDDVVFMDYDNVLYLDGDVYPTETCLYKGNDIFWYYGDLTYDIGICTEPFQPEHRQKFTTGICSKSDEAWAKAIADKWNVDMPRTDNGLLKVYNAGVVLYSKAGLKKAREKFVPIIDYVRYIKSKGLYDFYCHDQNYLHAMLMVADMNYVEMKNEWNSIISPHWNGPSKTKQFINDGRTKDTNLVHIQLKKNDHFEDNLIDSIVNDEKQYWEFQI